MIHGYIPIFCAQGPLLWSMWSSLRLTTIMITLITILIILIANINTGWWERTTLVGYSNVSATVLSYRIMLWFIS